LPWFETGGEHHHGKAHPDKSAHLYTLAFPQASHQAVAPLLHHRVEPAVAAVFVARAAIDQVEKTGIAVFKRHTPAQALEHGVVHLAVHPYRVLPVYGVAGMGKAMGELAVLGKEQQAAGVHVQSADGKPALFRFGKVVENRMFGGPAAFLA